MSDSKTILSPTCPTILSAVTFLVCAEIERYMAIPGQALGYKTGAMKIAALRRKYESALGTKFNLADFHNEVLKDGSLPLAVFEAKMDAWASGKK
jgi:uncharacterized protein (DUF885 family)